MVNIFLYGYHVRYEVMTTTPRERLSSLSIACAHEAQCIPVTGRSIRSLPARLWLDIRINPFPLGYSFIHQAMLHILSVPFLKACSLL